MKTKIETLKAKYISAATDSERDTVREEMRNLCDENAGTVAEAALESIMETNAALRASVGPNAEKAE